MVNSFRGGTSTARRSYTILSLLLIIATYCPILVSEPPKRPVDSEFIVRVAPSAMNERADDALAVPRNDDDRGSRSTTLRVVSFNIAGDLSSSEAPASGWNKDAAVREAVLGSSSTTTESTFPDVVALQECPRGGAEWAEALFGDAYVVTGARYSHADAVVLLARRDVAFRSLSSSLDGSVPAVAAELDLADGRRVVVASVHLAPFRGNAHRRAAQTGAILEVAAADDVPVVIVGDINMRPSEDDQTERGLGLVDLWKFVGSDPVTEHTWDTTDHRKTRGRQGRGRNYFNRFYGDDTRQYKARYDRLYVRPTDAVTLEREGSTFALIANEPVGNSSRHFVSDHFGLRADVRLSWNN